MVLLDKKVNPRTMIDYREIDSNVHVDANGNATYRNLEGEFVTVRGCEGIIGDLYRNIINTSIPPTDPSYPYEVQATDLVITLQNGRRVYIENFVKQRGESKFKYIGWGPFQQNVGKDIYAEGLVYNRNRINAYNLSTDHLQEDITNTNIVGTNVNDYIDLSEFKLVNGTLVNQRGQTVTKTTINAGVGNDEIIGSAVNDTITGGTGNNTLFINKNNELYGNDIYKLTKDEELIIKNISSYNADGEEQGLDGKHSFQRFFTNRNNAVIVTSYENKGAELSVDSTNGAYYDNKTDTFDSVDRGTTYCIVEIPGTEKKVSQSGKSINAVTGAISDVAGTVPPYYQLTLNTATEVGIGTERYSMTPSRNINFLAASTDYYSFTAASDITMRQILDAGNVYTLDTSTGNYSLYGDITNFAYYDTDYVEITGNALDVTMANDGRTLYVKYAGSDTWYQAGTAGQNYFYKLNNGADSPYTGTVGSLSLLYKKVGNNFNVVSDDDRKALIGYLFTNSPENSTIDETATEMNKLDNIYIGNAYGGYTYIAKGSLVSRYDLGYVYYEAGERKIDTAVHAYNGKASDAKFLYESSSLTAGSAPAHVDSLYYAKYYRSDATSGMVDIANFAKNPTDNVTYEYFDYSNGERGSVKLKDVYFENYDQESNLYKYGRYNGNALNEVVDGNIATRAMTVNAGEGNNTIVTNQGYQGVDTWADPALKDNIRAGSGNDIAYASAGDDTYKLGAGQNEIRYNHARFIGYGAGGEGYKYDEDHVEAFERLTGAVGDDIVNLTKDEQLTISDFYDNTLVSEGSYQSGEGLKGKHLVELKRNDVILHRAVDYGDGAGSITLKNFAAAGTNAEAFIVTNNPDAPISLNDFVYYVDATNGYNGTKLNELIDAHEAARGVRITTGAGSDIVIGSTYNDIVNAGSGSTEILTNTSVASFGDDTINLTKGSTLSLRDLNDSNAEWYVSKDANGVDIYVTRYNTGDGGATYGTYTLKGLGRNNDLARVRLNGLDGENIFNDVNVFAERGGNVIGTKGNDKIYLLSDRAANITMTYGSDSVFGSLQDEALITAKSVNVNLNVDIHNCEFIDQTDTTNYFTIVNGGRDNLASDELAIRTNNLSKITVTDTNRKKYDVAAYRGQAANIELDNKLNHIAFLEGDNAQIVTDSNKNDVINAYNNLNNTFNYINGGADIYTGGSGNDTYNVEKFDKNTSLVIKYSAGNDVLNFAAGANENMTLFFDVDMNRERRNDFYFVHNDIAQNATRVNLPSNLQLLKGMVEFDRFDVEDNTIQFGGVTVENLAEKINYIAQNVQTWLLNNGNYGSAMDVLIEGNKNDVASLMQAYTCDLVNQPVPTL